MSFRKRNIGLLGSSRGEGASPISPKAPTQAQLPGVRPSPIDGRPTTSTGTVSLDNLLAGHSGLTLGSSVLIEESGTTDYAGALLRFYAAEGLVQGHHVYVVGLPQHWGRELPGVVGESEKRETPAQTEKMKIAWRYESQGQFGAGISSRGGHTFVFVAPARPQFKSILVSQIDVFLMVLSLSQNALSLWRISRVELQAKDHQLHSATRSISPRGSSTLHPRE